MKKGCLMTQVLSVHQSPEIPSAHPLLAIMLNTASSPLLRVAAQFSIATLWREGPKTVPQPSSQRRGGAAMRACSLLLAFIFLLLSSAPAAFADFIFNNGTTNTVTSPINDRVQILNNTVVIFNAGGNVTAFASLGGFLTASLAAVSVFDTSHVIDNAANLTGTMSTGGCNVNTASGLSAWDDARVSVSGGTFTGLVSSGGGGPLRAQGLSAAGNSQVSVSGGSFTASGASSNFGLLVLDNAQVTLFGNGFNFPLGPISALTGTITGTLQSGESINVSFSQSHSGQIILSSGDEDGDGVPDINDDCSGTLANEVVNENGCSIDQLCPCETQWRNHGQYVSCIARAAEDFVAAGLITGAEQGAIVSEAGRSSCGK